MSHPPRYIDYAGRRFYLQSTGRYYQSGRKEDAERLLHRRVWSDANGPIPDGFEIHHINDDWVDNRLENLEPITVSDHRKLHSAAYMAKPGYREWLLENLKKAQVAAKDWHASDEGIAWHREQGKRTWVGREAIPKTCEHCSQVFEAMMKKARFCSKACLQMHKAPSLKTIESTCPQCGVRFMANKYRPAECCSKSCATSRRNRERRR